MSKKSEEQQIEKNIQKFLESQSKQPVIKKHESNKDPFMAQCNCTLKYYEKSTFDDFKKKHEETLGHELKVISP